MSTESTSPAASPQVPRIVPLHWTPEQALAVFECLQALREALWIAYGPQVQQDWRDQLVPDGPMPEFDQDVPF